MRNFLLAFVAMALIFTACKKEVPQTPVADTVELEFVIDQTDFGGLKSTDAVPKCQDLAWSYVTFKIDDGTVVTEYTSEVIHMPNGDQLTQVVKLPSTGSYTLTEFLVYNDVLPIGPGVEDILIRAAPADGSTYWDLMINKLDLPIVVEDFKKKQILIDVLCFEDLYYEGFGFFWFEMNDVKIERQCFFGDVCTGKISDFSSGDPANLSWYEQQSQGLQMDMPAIMKMEVYKEGALIRTFDNEGDFAWNETTQEFEGFMGEGACLEVYWANDLDVTENFEFKIYVWLPYGSGFAWKLIDTYPFQDENCPDPGDDGVVDITVGNCNIDGADYVYPAYMDIPDYATTFTMRLGAFGPSPQGTYIDAKFTGIPAGFDISDGNWGSWCGDKDHTIYTGTDYTTRFINSIEPLPVGFTQLNVSKLNMLNWLFNYLPLYFEGINLTNLKDFSGSGFSDGDWSIIQNAIWNITDDKTFGGKAGIMSAAAVPTFNPMPGQYAAVLMEVEVATGEKEVQLLFVMIDP